MSHWSPQKVSWILEINEGHVSEFLSLDKGKIIEKFKTSSGPHVSRHSCSHHQRVRQPFSSRPRSPPIRGVMAGFATRYPNIEAKPHLLTATLSLQQMPRHSSPLRSAVCCSIRRHLWVPSHRGHRVPLLCTMPPCCHAVPHTEAAALERPFTSLSGWPHLLVKPTTDAFSWSSRDVIHRVSMDASPSSAISSHKPATLQPPRGPHRLHAALWSNHQAHRPSVRASAIDPLHPSTTTVDSSL
jgi:hypothetical protein